MQKRLKARSETRAAKLEILQNAWCKLLGRIHDNNLVVNNRQAERLIIQIGRVAPAVRDAALEEFLRCSQRVHTIAFLQWRLKFPNKTTKQD